MCSRQLQQASVYLLLLEYKGLNCLNPLTTVLRISSNVQLT